MSAHITDLPDYDVVPGTVYLVEESHLTGTAKDIILLPSPAADIKDPLRWSRWRKAYHLFLLVAYSSVLGAFTNWESPIYLQLVQHYQTPINNLNVGTAVTLLLLGIGNIFFVPLSNKLGRRAVYNGTLLIVLFAEIWMALSRNIGDWQGAHVLLGLGAAPFEALVPISVADVWFAHERGAKLGAYVFGLAFGSFVGPICSGYMSVNMGWRWVYWWGVIIVAALLILFFFTFEESRFVRPHGAREADNNIVSVHEVDTAARSLSRTSDDIKEKKNIDEELQRELSALPRAGEVFESDSYTLQLKLWRTYPEPWLEIISEFWRPLKVSVLPAVIWCGINYGTCVSWLAVMATTIANVFARPPYLFSNSDLGLIWISPMIGSLIGAYFSGPLNDKFTIYLAKRNKGWREPEYKLWALLPSAIIMPAGLILYGVTSAYGMRWIIPIVGTGFVGFGLSVGGTISMGYILDCYKDIDTQVMTTVIVIRNIVGFGITWGIQPWIQGMGQRNAFILVGVLSFIITGAAVVFIIFGKALRRMTATRYAKLIAQSSTYLSR